MFERREDFRYFLALLACAVRRKELEVHAYSLMATHFHLLVRSPAGRLAEAMHHVQLAYSRRFNRTRRRDGPLVRSRFRSKPVRSLRYRRVLVAYIDANAPSAGLVNHAIEYPFGSARHYARVGGPPWLERGWVESEVTRRLGLDEYCPERYVEVFGRGVDGSVARFVERRLAAHEIDDPLDDLVRSAPGRVLSWMRRKAELADGTSPGLALAPLEFLDQVLLEARSENWIVAGGGRGRDGWPVARVGLARDLCGASLAEMSEREGLASSSISKLHGLHRGLLVRDALYGRRIDDLARRVLESWEAR
jgi:REP element-mobilizing transposase RayT